MNQSDNAVRDATGRTWSEWEVVLDEAGVEGLSHKEIVAWLEEHGGIESGWWRWSRTGADCVREPGLALALVLDGGAPRE